MNPGKGIKIYAVAHGSRLRGQNVQQSSFLASFYVVRFCPVPKKSFRAAMISALLVGYASFVCKLECRLIPFFGAHET
jgi:hypothetical protein